MARDGLKDLSDYYDAVVIGSGLGGLTGANCLARRGHSVLLLEHHCRFGGLATWFHRKGGHIFDVSLHGFPFAMIKSCRKYWSREIADSIVRLKNIRFINPQLNVHTTFDRADFVRVLSGKLKVARDRADAFFDYLRTMNFYGDISKTTRELFEEFFPGRDDVHRLLLEPISYANGSTLDDPAVAYGIVFNNFISRGVYTFLGGTEALLKKMIRELRRNGVDLRRRALAEKIITDGKTVRGVWFNGREVRCGAVLSNANLKSTIEHLTGEDQFSPEFIREAKKIRLNNSSCQVYIGIKPGESLPDLGDIVFFSEAEHFTTEELARRRTHSRSFSFYYPKNRPQNKTPRYAVVATANSKWEDWNGLSPKEYHLEKKRLCEETVSSLEKIIPGIRNKIGHLEAATPRTIHHYTRHLRGASFGTKFEGLKTSEELPRQIAGLFHAGSVGIIMSGWLGAVNYGVITAHKMDQYLSDLKKGARKMSAQVRHVLDTKERSPAL